MKNCVLIIGFGKSGKWAYNLALKLGYMPLIFDDGFSDLKNCWIYYNSIDFAVVSPGVPPTHKLIQKLNEKNVSIISEIEFCYLARENKHPIIGITGTNGKTTVTEMISGVLAGEVTTCGNIGKPWSEVLVKQENSKYTLLELSSFQLNNINLFHPKIAVLTNFAPDHIDYHGSFENYIDAKMKLTKNMDVDDFVIYNGEDGEVKKRVILLRRPRVLYFSEERLSGEGIYFEKNNVVLSYAGESNVLFSLPENSHFEKHTRLNILASSLVCSLLGVDGTKIRESLLKFKPSMFRQTEVKNDLGIRIINDSKATNLSAVLMAVSEHKSDVLLVGGKGKNESYLSLFSKPTFHDIVVYGEMGEEVVGCAKICGFQNIVYYKKFDDAVKVAVKLTKVGETLLFSPAGSSFDQFTSYQERGERFNFLIRDIERENS